MPLGLPLTIWRYTLVELTRHFLISGSVLVTVLSFAVTVQQVSDGTLGTLDALKFMALAAVPMTAYALPFACGFAATMVFHRMAQDNELLAANAGGVGYLRLLAPVAGFGLGVSVVLGGVNDQLIPRFWRSMESMLTEDVARLMSLKLASGETVQLGNGVMVYAEAVREPPLPDDSEARNVLLLVRPAFVELGDDESVEWDATAGRAWAWFYGDEAGTRVVIRAEDVAATTGDGRVETASVARTYLMEGGLKDDPKFMTLSEMRRVREDPDSTNMPDYFSRRLAFWLSNAASLEAVDGAVASGQPVVLAGAEGTTIRVWAALAEGGDRGRRLGGASAGEAGDDDAGEPRSVRVEVEQGGETDRLWARVAAIRVEADRSDTSRVATYQLEVTDVAADEPGRRVSRPTRQFGSLRVAGVGVERVSSSDSRELLAMADERLAGTPRPLGVEASAARLEEELEDIELEVVSKTHERFALTGLAIVMAMSGAVTAVVFQRKLPLQAYLATFFPSLGSVLLVSLGQQVTHESGGPGLPLLWGGAAAQAVGTLVVLVMIRRR
ncbi:MAG: LptF/LptG family permease [Planctomycetota bacterium]